jgi:hypothetical protein
MRYRRSKNKQNKNLNLRYKKKNIVYKLLNYPVPLYQLVAVLLFTLNGYYLQNFQYQIESLALNVQELKTENLAQRDLIEGLKKENDIIKEQRLNFLEEQKSQNHRDFKSTVSYTTPEMLVSLVSLVFLIWGTVENNNPLFIKTLLPDCVFSFIQSHTPFFQEYREYSYVSKKLAATFLLQVLHGKGQALFMKPDFPDSSSTHIEDFVLSKVDNSEELGTAEEAPKKEWSKEMALAKMRKALLDE